MIALTRRYVQFALTVILNFTFFRMLYIHNIRCSVTVIYDRLCSKNNSRMHDRVAF